MASLPTKCNCRLNRWTNYKEGGAKRRDTQMELILALIVFALLIVAWLVLPGSFTVEETPAWSSSEALQMTPAEA